MQGKHDVNEALNVVTPAAPTIAPVTTTVPAELSGHPVIDAAQEARTAGEEEREIPGVLARQTQVDATAKVEAEKKAAEAVKPAAAPQGVSPTELSADDRHWQSRHDVQMARVMQATGVSTVAEAEARLDEMIKANQEQPEPPRFSEDFDIAEIGTKDSNSGKELFDVIAKTSAEAARSAVREEIARDHAFDRLGEQYHEARDPRIQAEYQQYLTDPSKQNAGYIFEAFMFQRGTPVQPQHGAPAAPGGVPIQQGRAAHGQQGSPVSLVGVQSTASTGESYGKQDDFQNKIVERYRERSAIGKAL